MQGHCLIGVGEIPVVPVRSHRNAGDYGRIQLRGIEAPLFPCVTAEQLLVQITAHPADHHVFGGPNRLPVFATEAK